MLVFVYYINIPLNDIGVFELENYDDTLANVKSFELTEKQYKYLRYESGIFDEFDKAFDIIIDLCEEEVIEYKDLKNAIKIANKYLKKAKNNFEKEAYLLIIESLELALKSKTYWEIDIYLDSI